MSQTVRNRRGGDGCALNQQKQHGLLADSNPLPLTQRDVMTEKELSTENGDSLCMEKYKKESVA